MSETNWQQSKAFLIWRGLKGRRKTVKMTRLQRARLMTGLSVEEAARATGRNPGSWRHWELVGRRHRIMSEGNAWALSGFYAITMDALMRRPYVTVNPDTLEVLP